jgi:diguanylate cyclase (GGDEF)-like protein
MPFALDAVSPAARGAVAALQAYLDAEEAFDLAAIEPLIPEDHCGFGTGGDEIVLGREQVLALLRRQFAEVSSVVSQRMQLLHTQELTPDCILIMARIRYEIVVNGQHEQLEPRFTFVMRRAPSGAWQLAHLHASIPWRQQEAGESFPIHQIEERARMLEALVADRTRELEQTLELVQKLAVTDKLTGLANRARLDQLIADEHRQLQRTPRASSIAILDLDHFKEVNDTHGHLVGDRVLQSLAEVLGQCVREVDRVGRWGGEEFLVLLPDASRERARLVADRIRDRLRTHDFGLAANVTVSAGIAEYRRGETVDAWLSRADKMLYEAKHAGRDRVQVDG